MTRHPVKTLDSRIQVLLDSLSRIRRPVADPFDDVIGLAEGDGSAVAENHADYLYRWPVET